MPSAGTIQFGTQAYGPSPGSSSVVLTVTRIAGTSGAISVSYSTSNGTAAAGTDYTTANGTLSWTDGDGAAKTITITLGSNAPTFSSYRTFTATLSAPSGGAALGSPVTATISIAGTASTSGTPMGQTAAARLLMQGTFGATIADLNAAASQSYDAWFSGQAAVPASINGPKTTNNSGDWSTSWYTNAVQGPDQLRQRMAFALSEILVVSGNGGPLWSDEIALANYYDVLVNNALGNYRTLLEQVTLSPAMGQFLAMLRNNKPDPVTGYHADQNYAREVMQLFTVGLVQLNSDGTPKLDANGQQIPTYAQADVVALSNVFTGWSSPGTATPDINWLYALDQIAPMVAYENHHDTDAKTIIGGTAVPAGQTAAADLKIALDTLFNHPNVGPFLSRQLIQRLVTSNPSPSYVQRVANVFANDGSGVRGNLLAVARAILTDPEATSPGGASYGKIREPLVRLTNLWRAFSAVNANGDDGEWIIQNLAISNFGEGPLMSPTVFNFFAPTFQPSGPLANAGMVAPEAQVLNESTLVLTANYLQREAYQFIDSNGVVHAGADFDLSSTIGSGNVMLHTAQWESLASNPASLIDQMNLLFMAGQMPGAMRSALISYVNAIPAANAASRAVEAAELIINSPQYAVQR
jgi:uncharacterized protein (DUF1800 family)